MEPEIVFSFVAVILSGWLSYLVSKRQFAMQKEETGEQGQNKKIDSLTEKLSHCVTWTQFDEKETKRIALCQKEHANIVEKMELTFNNHMLKTELLYDKISEGSENLLKDQAEFKDFVLDTTAGMKQQQIDNIQTTDRANNLFGQLEQLLKDR